ncbi:MAG: DUF6391 domain-containing protein [Chloroflexota bacterium]
MNHTLSRIRRNHGLEHATIHVMSEKFKNFSAQGNSDHKGFNLNIYGNIKEDEVFECVEEAFERMKNGEHHLAVHPNCGTVLLTTATMATLAAQLAFTFEQKRRKSKLTPTLFLNVLPTAVLMVVVSLIISKPIGVHLQARYTVEGNLRDMQLLRMRKVSPNPITQIFQYLLTGGQNNIKATAYRIETIG